MGRTATTGEFKDDSFKIKLTTSDKVSKYSVFFKDKKFELGKLTFNFSRETYSIPEKLVKFFNVTKTTDNTMNFLKNVDGLYDFYTESDKSFGGSIKALKNVTGIGKNSKAFSIFDKYGTKTVKTSEAFVMVMSYDKDEKDFFRMTPTIKFEDASGRKYKQTFCIDIGDRLGNGVIINYAQPELCEE